MVDGIGYFGRFGIDRLFSTIFAGRQIGTCLMLGINCLDAIIFRLDHPINGLRLINGSLSFGRFITNALLLGRLVFGRQSRVLINSILDFGRFGINCVFSLSFTRIEVSALLVLGINCFNPIIFSFIDGFNRLGVINRRLGFRGFISNSLLLGRFFASS